MNNEINISGFCLSTFNSAGNGVFSLCKNTDNQHCYDCANSTAFTGKERDAETGYSYFGARYYDSDLSGLFLSVDPMSDKYPEISPYNYCHWNPLKTIDTDGEDEWDIDEQGHIVNHIKTNKHDAFFIVDKNGNRMMDEQHMVMYKSISFTYGTVSELPDNRYLTGTSGFSIIDNSSGADLFKFFADNTSVEYGLITTGNRGAVVMTNHNANRVGVSLYAKVMNDNGANVISVTHNHPSGKGPSGFRKSDTHGDRIAARNLIFSGGVAVSYYVYTKNGEKMYNYDQSQKVGEFSWKTFIRKIQR